MISERKKTVLICLCLGIITFISFEQVRLNDFVYDDCEYVTNNEQVQSGLSLKSFMWCFKASTANWHPVTWLSHLVDYELFGLNASGHHLANLFFHITNTLLLFCLLRCLTGSLWASAFTALLFGIHPLHVESVAWVAERKDVLSTFFFFLTILVYLHYTRKTEIRRYIPVVVLFVLGLMTKPMVVTLPFVLLLLDYWPLERCSIRSLLEKIPLLILTIISCVVTFIVQHNIGATGLMEDIPFKYRLANAISAYVGYIIKLLLPVNLTALYPHPGSNISLTSVVISLLILLSISSAVICAARKRKYLVTGWLWYIGTLVPVIGLVQVGSQSMADRYTYIPSIGLFIILTWGLSEISGSGFFKKAILTACAGVAIVLLVICTRIQVGYWKNNIVLFSHALEVTENNPLAYYNIANEYQSRKNFDQALTYYYKALEVDADYADTYHNLGLIHKQEGKIEESIEYYYEALRCSPDNTDTLLCLGAAYLELGDSDQAIEMFSQILAIEPKNIDARSNLGVTMIKMSRTDKAIEYFNEILSIDPENSEAYNNLGKLFAEMGNLSLAISNYKIGLEFDDNFAPLHSNLGMALYVQGRMDEATVHLYKAIKLDPQPMPKVLNILGISLSRQGKFQQAAIELQKYLQIKPDDPVAHNELGVVLANMHQVDPAIEHFSEALRLKPDFEFARENLQIARSQKTDLQKSNDK